MYYKVYDWFNGEGYKGYRNTLIDAFQFAAELQNSGNKISRIAIFNEDGQEIDHNVLPNS